MILRLANGIACTRQCGEESCSSPTTLLIDVKMILLGSVAISYKSIRIEISVCHLYEDWESNFSRLKSSNSVPSSDTEVIYGSQCCSPDKSSCGSAVASCQCVASQDLSSWMDADDSLHLLLPMLLSGWT